MAKAALRKLQRARSFSHAHQLVCVCLCVSARRLSCLFQSRWAFEGLVLIKVEMSLLELKKKEKKMPAFYAGQKSRWSQNETHERLRGNLGTKQQLDDTPYAPRPIIHHFSLACTRVHPVDCQGST